MAPSPSSARRLWIVTAAYVAMLYASAYLARFPMRFLEQRKLVGPVALAIVAIAAVVVLAVVASARPRLRELALLAVIGLAYLAVMQQMKYLGEKIHLLEYGLLGILVVTALGRSRPAADVVTAGSAVALTALIGWGEEGVQWLVPGRVYDPRDVLFNASGGALAVIFVVLRRRIRSPHG